MLESVKTIEDELYFSMFLINEWVPMFYRYFYMFVA